MTRASRALVLSWPEGTGDGQVAPSPFYDAARDALGAEEEIHEEELFGPGRGPSLDLPDAPRRGARVVMARRVGAVGDAPGHGRGRDPGRGALSRADQARGPGPAPRHGAGRRGDRGAQRAARTRRVARAAGGARGVRARRVRGRRGARRDRSSRAGRRAPRALARAVHPPAGRRPGAARPRTSTSTGRARSSTSSRASSRFRGSRRSTSASGSSSTRSSSASTPRRCGRTRSATASPARARRRRAASTACWSCSRRAGGARDSAPPTTSSSTATGPSRPSPATTSASAAPPRGRCGSSAASRSRSATISFAAGSTASTRRADGGYELIDYKTGEQRTGQGDDVQLALYRLGRAFGLGDRGRTGSYWYVLGGRARRGAGRARRRRARRADRARGRRRDRGPGLRAAPVVRDLQLVRLPADLPGVARPSSRRGRAAAGSAGSPGRWSSADGMSWC